ncbi:TonB-dependent receptor [Pseudomonas qingdaonensis]|nr:TonB-dependent receptor [Pseudomonas qingdaonensis]
MHQLHPLARGIGLGLLLAGTSTAHADDSTTPALKTVTVTAQHREETLQEVPVAVSAVQGTSITADGVRAMGDITTFIPNASAKNPDGDGRPRWYIRGLGTGDTGAATVYPVGIYADDVYLNAPVAGGGPLFDLERIEVLRGPQGTLYGKNTTAGAVNVISKKPTFDTDGFGTIGFGSKNERILNGALGGTPGGRTPGRPGVAVFRGARRLHPQPDQRPDLGDVNKKAVRVQFLARLNPDLEALWKLHGRQFKGDGSSGSLPLGTYYNVGYQRPRAAHRAERGRALQTRPRRHLADPELGHRRLPADLHHRLRLYPPAVADRRRLHPYEVNGASDTDNRYDQYSQEFRLASPQQETLRWMLGTHYFHETLDSTDRRFVTPGPTPNGTGSNQIGGVDLSSLDYTHKTDSYALFGNLAYDLSDNFTVTGGLRWTTEKKSIDLDLAQLTRTSANGPLVPLGAAGANGNRDE